MKVRHAVDESILLPKTKKVVAAAAIVAIVVVSSGLGSHADAKGQGNDKMRHDGYMI